MSLTPRATKGAPLTNDEGDAAFNGLDGRVTTAQTAATNAQTTASSAQSAAGTANTTASQAQATAQAANTTATNAVPKTRTVGGVALSADVPLKTVGGIPITGTGDIPVGSGSGGSAAAITVAYSTAIPLDTPGAGKRMNSHKLSSSEVLSVAAAPTEDGNCNFCIVGDGSHTLDVTAFRNGNSYSFDGSNNRQNVYSAVYEFGTAYLFGMLGVIEAAAPTAPVFTGAVMADATPNKITLSFDQTLGSSTSVIASDYTFTGLDGRTVTGVTRVGSTVEVTFSVPFTAASAVTVAIAASKIFNATNSLSMGALAAQSVSNTILPVSGGKLRLPTLGPDSLETGSAGAGWNYSATTVGYRSIERSATNTTAKLAAGVNGYVRGVLAGSGSLANGFSIGLFPSTADLYWPSGGYSLAAPDPASGFYATGAQYGWWPGNGQTDLIPVAGDLVQIRRVGSTIYGEVYQGGAWHVINTWTPASTGDLYVIFWGGAGVLLNDITTDAIA